MARKPKITTEPEPAKRRPIWVVRVFWYLAKFYVKSLAITIILLGCFIGAFKWIDPPITYEMVADFLDKNQARYVWRDLDTISPNISLATAFVVDKNFCEHDGFSADGTKTISQKVARSMFLWPGDSEILNTMEYLLVITIETLWQKRRIMEMYLNINKSKGGTFGVFVSSHALLSQGPEKLSKQDAARLAVYYANLNPTTNQGSPFEIQRQINQITAGSGTLRNDGKADCFL